MVIDSSALIALLLGEPETERFVAAIAAAPSRLMSAGSYLETAIVITGRLGPGAKETLDRLMDELSIAIFPVLRDHADAAVAAYLRYGRGSGHLANLNFGDCFAYALAKSMAEPLLYKGNDFVHTDIASAL